MSRDATGIYTLAAGNPVTTGTTVSSTWANLTFNDIATAIDGSLSRSGGANSNMLAPLPGYVGTVSLPGYTFSGDTNTGLYWVAADDFAAAVGGAKVQEWAATGSTMVLGLTLTQGQANANGLTSTGNGTGSGGNFTGGATGSGVIASGGASGNGVVCSPGATTGVALFIQTGNTVLAPIRMQTSAQPTGASAVGDMYMTAAGILKVCTVAGTPGTWVSVGTQV